MATLDNEEMVIMAIVMSTLDPANYEGNPDIQAVIYKMKSLVERTGEKSYFVKPVDILPKRGW